MPPLWRERMRRLLDGLRVETQGKYSAERVVALAKYHRETSIFHRVAVLMLTPVPCLLITLLLELIPLDPPSKGARANLAVHGRGFLMLTTFSFLIFYQFGHYLPLLPFSTVRGAVQSVVVGFATISVIYTTGCLWGFPIPFSIIILSPVWIGFEYAAMGVAWGSFVRQHFDELRGPIKNALITWSCQIVLVSIYPIYYYGYSLLSLTGRTALAFFLPVIKLVMRVLFNHSVVHLQDELPEVVVLNVEVFNALFMMYCMQITPSLITTACLMAIDVTQSAASLLDAYAIAKEINFCEERQQGPGVGLVIAVTARKKSFLNKAAAILAMDRAPVPSRDSIRRASSARVTTRMTRSLNARRLLPVSSKIRPKSYAILPGVPMGTSAFENARVVTVPQPVRIESSTGDDRASVDAVQRLLYVTEFLMLLNYVEVVIPVIYVTYLSAVYHLPNLQYYPNLASMSDSQILSTLSNLLLYASMELVSLLTLHAVLKRKFRLPGLAQLAFVLEKQWGGVQMKLVFFVLYTAQPQLQHLGFDYTFKFEWLQREQESAPS